MQTDAGSSKAAIASQIARGEEYEHKGEDQQAEASYRSALASDSSSIEAIVHLASLLEREKQIAASIRFWKLSVSLKPDNVEFQSSLGAAYLEAGKNDGAVQTLEAVIKQKQGDGAALINLGTALTRLDRYPEAAEVYRKAEAVPEFTDTAKLSLAKVSITLVRYNEALLLLESYTKKHPNYVEASGLLGITYQRLNRNADAATELRKAVALNESDFDNEYRLGALLRAEGNDEEAIAFLKKATALKPESQGAHFQLARAHHAMHEIKLASQEEASLNAIESARVIDTQVTILENEARQAQQEHNLAKALSLYQEILSKLPRDAKVRYDLALVYEQLKDRPSERNVLEEALVLDPSLALVHSQLGFLDIAEGQSDKGEAQLRMALQEDPQNVESLGNLGVLDAKTNKLKEAEHLLELAVEIDPQYEKGFLNLGLVFASQGNYKSAVSALTAAISLDPGDISATRVLKQIRLHNKLLCSDALEGLSLFENKCHLIFALSVTIK